MKPLYTTEALATGAGRDGHVDVVDSDLALDLAVPTAMGGTGKGAGGTGTSPATERGSGDGPAEGTPDGIADGDAGGVAGGIVGGSVGGDLRGNLGGSPDGTLTGNGLGDTGAPGDRTVAPPPGQTGNAQHRPGVSGSAEGGPCPRAVTGPDATHRRFTGSIPL